MPLAGAAEGGPQRAQGRRWDVKGRFFLGWNLQGIFFFEHFGWGNNNWSLFFLGGDRWNFTGLTVFVQEIAGLKLSQTGLQSECGLFAK